MHVLKSDSPVREAWGLLKTTAAVIVNETVKTAADGSYTRIVLGKEDVFTVLSTEKLTTDYPV